MDIKVVIDSLALAVSVLSLFISHRVKVAFEDEEEDLESKRFFLSLWPQLVEVNQINPQNPVAANVRKAVNTLELVALLWEANVVNKDMIVISFGDNYVARHQEILQIMEAVQGDGRNGPQILSAHPAIGRVLPDIQKSLAGRAEVHPTTRSRRRIF
jgi:hypothetical protein